MEEIKKAFSDLVESYDTIWVTEYQIVNSEGRRNIDYIIKAHEQAKRDYLAGLMKLIIDCSNELQNEIKKGSRDHGEISNNG